MESYNFKEHDFRIVIKISLQRRIKKSTIQKFTHKILSIKNSTSLFVLS